MQYIFHIGSKTLLSILWPGYKLLPSGQRNLGDLLTTNTLLSVPICLLSSPSVSFYRPLSLSLPPLSLFNAHCLSLSSPSVSLYRPLSLFPLCLFLLPTVSSLFPLCLFLSPTVSSLPPLSLFIAHCLSLFPLCLFLSPTVSLPPLSLFITHCLSLFLSLSLLPVHCH